MLCAGRQHVTPTGLAPPALGRLYYRCGDALYHLQRSNFPVSSPHYQLSISSPRAIMSTEPSTSTLHSNFQSIFNAALDEYKRKTKNDLTAHPLLPRFESCHTPEAILTVLRKQIPGFSESQNGDDGFTKWVTPTVNVLHAFSDTLGQGVGLVSIKTFFAKNSCSNIYF